MRWPEIQGREIDFELAQQPLSAGSPVRVSRNTITLSSITVRMYVASHTSMLGVWDVERLNRPTVFSLLLLQCIGLVYHNLDGILPVLGVLKFVPTSL